MSDFFMPTQNNQETKDQEIEKYRNAVNNVQNQEIEAFRQKKQQHLENWDRYGVNVPDEYYDAFNKIISQAATPEEAQEEAYKIGSAVKYSEAMGIPLLEAYQNVDAFNEAQFTDLQGQKGRFEALSDMLNLGRNNVKLGRLGQELMQAHGNNDTELANALMAEIDAINQQNQMMQDNAPRSWVMQALEAGAQSLPFTGVVAGAGIVGNFIAPAAGTAASFAASSYLSAGTEYIDMIANGASPETARLVANISGGIQGLIEADLGISKSIVKSTARVIGKEAAENAAKKSVEEISRKVFKRFHFGAGKKVLINYLENRGKDILGEGTEEFLQEITSIVGQEVAASLDGYDIPDDDMKHIVKQTTEAFKGGVLGALSMGFIPAGINAAADVREYKLIKDTAEAFESEEMFKEVAKDSPVFEGMSDEQKADTIHEVWQRAQNRKEIEAQQIAEGRDAAEGAEEAPAENEDGSTEANPVARDEAGRLYTTDDVSTDDAGNVTGGTFVVGDKTKSENNRYGYIKYSQDAEGNITIDTFKMTEGRDKLRAEAFDEFARQHPDVNIEWNATAPDLQDFKNELIDANPSGKKNGLNYYSTTELDNIQARKRVAEELRKNIHNVKRNADGSYTQTELNNKQIAAGVTLIESAARRMNMGLNEYINKTFGNQIFGSREEFAAASLAQGEDVNKKAGGMIQGVAQVNWKDVGQQIKAVIYAGEHADFSTWAHEMAHVFQNQLDGQLKTDAEAAFNVQNGDWVNSTYTFKGGRTMSSAEAFAYGFQDWLETGKAENEQMRNIFQKFAEFIADCYNRLKKHLDFTPEIESVFNQLLDGDDTIMSKALKAAQEQDNEYRASLKRQAEEKQAAKEAEKEEAKKQAEAAREEASEGTEFTEAAPTAEELLNGIEEAENETEKTDNAIDNALENTNLTDEQKEEIAEILKDESSTIVEKAEATTEAAESAYDDEAPIDLFQDEGKLLSQLIGEPSIRRMAESEERTRILLDLKLAQDMEADGKDAGYIRRTTGWENINNEWKYETDDSVIDVLDKANINKNLNTNPDQLITDYGSTRRNLDKVLDAPELFKIYPILKNVRVSFYKAEDLQRSRLSEDGILLNTRYLDKVIGPKSIKASLVYEIQKLIHALEHNKTKSDVGENIDEYIAAAEQLDREMRQAILRNNVGLNYDKKAIQEKINNIMSKRGDEEARIVASRVLLNADQRKWKTLAQSKAEEDVRKKEQPTQVMHYQTIQDPDLLEKLNSEPTIKVYRAMQVIDGEYYPPMATVVEGKRVESAKAGDWIQADENPELAVPDIDKKTGKQKVDKDGNLKWKFVLDKGGKDATGKPLTKVPAAYNPYWHTSRSPLNDQFSSAYKRPNLVTVEVEVPVSELTSGYKADRAKDAVGEMDWHSGPVSSQLAAAGKPRKVILSRYCKIDRVIPDSEVAQNIKDLLEGTDIAIPDNTITPSLKAELEKIGVKVEETEDVKDYNKDLEEATKKAQELLSKYRQGTLFQDEAGEIRKQYENTDQWMKAPNGADSKLNEKQWLQVRTPSFKKWFGDWEKDPQNASKVVDENGEPLVVYHGTKTKDVTVFDRSKIGSQTDQGIAGRGFYFTPDKMYTLNYTDNNDRNIIAAFLNIRNPYRLNDSTMKDFNDMYMKYTEGEYEEEYYQNLLKNPQTAFGDALEKGNKELIKKNYDGVIFSYDLRDEYVAFNSNQIKSATNNNGNFDANNPNILFQDEYDPRSLVPNVRGGWTEKKIIKYLKDNPTLSGVVNAIKFIKEFDTPEELKAHMFYHGTALGSDKLKPSITMSDRDIERYGGGGYGQKYWSISVSKSKKVASNFAPMSDGVRIYPIILAKNAKVIEMPELTDSVELEDHIIDLWNQGVDAVWIGDKDSGEQELSILNPRAVVNIGRADWYKNYALGTEKNPINIKDDEQIKEMFDYAKNYERKTELDFGKPSKPLMPMSPFMYLYDDNSKIVKDENGDAVKNPNYDAEYAEYEKQKEDYKKQKEEYEQAVNDWYSSDDYEEWEKFDRERRNVIFFQSINTAEQLEQTRSDAFKKWFGDWESDPQNASKVVDENGKPMVMYHETGNQFDTFDPRHGGAGNTDYMFPYGIFTKPTDKNIGVARNPIQMPLFVNMKKPLEVYSREDLENYLKNNVPGFKEDLEKLQNTDKEYEAKYDAAEKEYDAAFDDIYENHPEIWEDDAKRIAFGEEAEKPLNRILEEWKGAYAERAKALRNKVDDYFRNSNYDGIILKSDAGSFGRNVSSYVVFDPVQVKSAVNNNGNFDPYNPNILFQIAGEIGAENLDNSEVQEGVSRMQNLAIAKQMEAEGKDAPEIRMATSWEKGDDGKWRYELDDSKIKINLNISGDTEFFKLNEVLDNPELYIAYPTLKNVDVYIGKGDVEGMLGEYDPSINTLSIYTNNKEKGYLDWVKEAKKTVLHEVQHIIQDIEGFAKGGSTYAAGQYIEYENQKKTEIKNKAFAWEWKLELDKQEEKHPELKGQLALMNSLMDEYTENGKITVRELEEEHWIPNRDIRIQGFNLYVRGYDKAGFEDAYKEWQETASKKGILSFEPTKDTDRNRYNYYRRFAGEVESRNVETRINYTPEERLLATLKSTEDVAPEDKIILFQTVYYESENKQIVDKLLFQTNAELMSEAQDFDSWQEFMDYCEAFHADDEVSPIPGDADAQWYQTFYETAKGVQTEQEKNEEALKSTTKKETQLPAAVDALFTTMIASNPEMVDSFLQAVADIDAIDLDSEEWQQAENAEDAAQRDKIEQLKDFINITLSDYNWQTALRRIQGGHEISEGLRKRLIGEMRDNFKVRDFRALYAEVMNDEQYAVAPEDSITAVLNKKLKKYHDIVKPTDDITRWSPERRKQLAEQLQNRELADKIRRGDLKLDDELDAYIKSLNKQIKEKQKQFDELEAETKTDYQRIADKERRDLLKLHEQLLLARGKLKTRNQEIERKIKKGLKITEKYRSLTQNLNANYDEIFRKYSDLRNTITISAEVQAALDRQEQVAGLREDLNAKQKEKNLTAEVKKMRIQLVKKTMRRVPFNRIDYNNARTVIAIQRMLEPNLLGGVNRFIGIDSPYLRGVISQIVTDSDYKEKIMNYLSKNAKASQAFADFKKKLTELKSIKDFDSWTEKDRKAAIRYLPKENWVRDLNLKELAKEREESIDLDIGMEEIKRTVYDEKTGEPKTYKDAQGNEHTVTETAFKLKANEEIERIVQDAVGADMFDKIVNMPFSEWTTEDLETLAQRIDELYTEGRDLKAAKDEARKNEAAAIRKRIEDAIKETGITINDDDTPEEKERKQKQIDKILGMSDDLKGTEAGKPKGLKARLNRLLHSYSDMNVLRFGRMLDGQSEGENVRMLYRKEDDCYNAKQRSMNSRAEKIYKVMKDNNITERGLAEVVKVPSLGTEFTVDELLYFLAADKDYAEDEKKLQRGLFGIDANDDYAATSRNAVMFGNMMSDMMSQEEKESWLQLDKDMEEALQNDTLTQEQKEQQATGTLDKKPGTTRYIMACHAKWEVVLGAANNYLSTHPEYKALMEAIEEDYAEQYGRMNEVSINEFNMPVHRVKAYVPLVRRESNGDTNENQVKEDLLGAAGVGKQWADRGMTQRRVQISPLNQKPVQTGLFRTWGDSIERTEHFIAYAPYVRQLNAIYKSRDASYTRRYIESRYGNGAIKYLDEYINEVANPNAGRIRERGAEWLHVLRGKTAPAYLGWKASAIIKQGLTSPWPYMQFVNPAEYVAAAMKFTFNPEMREAIKEKSVFMKMRRMDPVNDLIDEMADNAKSKLDRGWSNFSKIGMQGLELIDWACVAPGWLACYEKKYNQLQNASNARYEAKMAELKERNMYAEVGTSEYLTPQQMEAEAKKEMLEDIEAEAVRYADDCTRACQPSNRVTDLAPLFKNSSEAMKAFLQFQTSLNVIWQNLRYDMPYAVKNKEFTRIAGTVIGYVCAGIFMNSVMEGIGGDDDDDETQALRNLIYYSTTQFTDSIPIMGSEITNTMDQLITGKRGFYGSGTDMTPSATKLLSVLTTAKKGNWEKAAELTAEGIGLYLGAPVSGAKEINKLLGKPLSEGDVNLKRGISDVYGIAGDIIDE